MDKPTPTPSSNNKTQDKKSTNWLAYSGMAIEMFVTIGMFTALGVFLDKKISSSPVFLISFMLIGLSISFYRIYKQQQNT